jgi:ribosomal 50S subunit-associated protein YjgA (DUF615 family)
MSKYDKTNAKKRQLKLINRFLDIKLKELELKINLSNISPNTHSHLIHTLEEIKLNFANPKLITKLKI